MVWYASSDNCAASNNLDLSWRSSANIFAKPHRVLMQKRKKGHCIFLFDKMKYLPRKTWYMPGHTWFYRDENKNDNHLLSGIVFEFFFDF